MFKRMLTEEYLKLKSSRESALEEQYWKTVQFNLFWDSFLEKIQERRIKVAGHNFL